MERRPPPPAAGPSSPEPRAKSARAAPATPIRFIFRDLTRFRRAFLFALVWSILFVVVPMQVPVLAGMLVSGLLGQPATFYGLWTVTGSSTVFEFAVIGLAAVAGAYGLTAYLSSYSVAELGRTYVREQQKRLIAKLDRTPIAFHQKVGSGELMSRVITDTESTRSFVTQVFFNTVQNVARVAFPVVALALLDPLVALVASAILPVEYLISRHLQHGLREASRRARSTKGRFAAAVKENLDGIETIQTSNAEGFAIARVAEEADQLAVDQIRVRTYFGLINGSTWALTSVGLALAWAVGGWQVLNGALTVGILVAATGYVAILYLPMQRFTSLANTYQTGMVAFERIREVLEMPTDLVDLPSAPSLRVARGEIELRDVTFAYGESPSLAHASLRIRGGRMTALVGPNGSGKSTVLKLIARLYDPAEGAVLVDGQDLREVRLASLRSQVAVVPQFPTIFSGTIEQNIRFGRPDAPPVEVELAAGRAGVLRFARSLPAGLATRIGPGGTRLSGGEAQRVAIARALLREPRILLLDEPNSALDPESEALLLRELSFLKGSVTVVLVAHHLDAVMSVADDVVVMEGGRAVERRRGVGVPGAWGPLLPPSRAGVLTA